MTDEADATSMETESAPTRPSLDEHDPKTKLNLGVRSALMALPGEFDFPHPISGVNATDLFNLNTFLGAGIEIEVVRTLNGLRHIWDKNSEWSEYRFERSSQAFPDVRLVARDLQGAETIALGIELKGWWILAKEGVPSLRYQVAPAACAPQDIVCVVPWYLSSAVSGLPQVAEPWVESALFAAEWRDYWWTTIRESAADKSVSYPPDAAPYPSKADRVTATPAYDGGGNYGRLPRSRPLMDTFISGTLSQPILGIEARAWVSFLKLHSDNASPEAIMENLQRQVQRRDRSLADDQAQMLLQAVRRLSDLLP